MIWRQIFVLLNLSLPGQWEPKENTGLRKRGLGYVVLCIRCVPWTTIMCWRTGPAAVFTGGWSWGLWVYEWSHTPVLSPWSEYWEWKGNHIRVCSWRRTVTGHVLERTHCVDFLSSSLPIPFLLPTPTFSLSLYLLPLSPWWKQEEIDLLSYLEAPTSIISYFISGSKSQNHLTMDQHLVLRPWIKKIFFFFTNCVFLIYLSQTGRADCYSILHCVNCAHPTSHGSCKTT